MRKSLPVAIRSCPRGAVVPARGPDGAPLAVVRLSSGQVCVVEDRCPHDGGPLSDGFIEDDQVVCTRHYRSFDPRRDLDAVTPDRPAPPDPPDPTDPTDPSHPPCDRPFLTPALHLR